MKALEQKTDKKRILEKLEEAIEKKDAAHFHSLYESFLYDKLEEKIETLKGSEELVPSALDYQEILSNAAKSFGAYDIEFFNGVMVLCFRNKQSVENFFNFLEICDEVDHYDVDVYLRYQKDMVPPQEEIDYDDIDYADDRFEFLVTVYLKPDYVYLVGDKRLYRDLPDENEDEEEELKENEAILDEVIRKIRITSTGKRIVKMKCPKGFKWNHTAKKCEKITGKELVNMRKRVRKMLLTKKMRGPALKIKTLRKFKKALRFRKMMGKK